MAVGSGTNLAFTLGEAAADLRELCYRFVTLGSSGVDKTGAGAEIDGILQNKPNLGEGCTVQCVEGVTSKLVVDAGTDIAIGDFLKSDTNGKGVKASGGDVVGAKALQAATADGDIIEVLITKRLM